MAETPGGVSGGSPDAGSAGADPRVADDGAGRRRVVHVMELLLFVLVVACALVVVKFFSATLLVAVLVALVLLFGTVLASRAEPGMLGRWLRRLLERLAGGGSQV